MTTRKAEATQKLMDGILEGRVPRETRFLAARGLLPVAREDLLRLQLVLSTDPDEGLAATAARSVGEASVEVLRNLVTDDQLGSLELDLLVRNREDEELWVAVAASRKCSDETLRRLARHGSPLVQDVVITNQVRLLQCLDVLEDLRQNPRATQPILRRTREFEEEFIRKQANAVAKGEEGEAAEPGPTIAEALAALKALGGHIPADERLFDRERPDDELAREAKTEGKTAFADLLMLNTQEKILRALKGSREDRSILINSRNRLVAQAVLESPKVGETEIERFACSRSVSEDVIRKIAAERRWLRRYAIVVALAGNPKTPVRIAQELLPKLQLRDLKQLERDRNVSSVVRAQAARVLKRKR